MFTGIVEELGTLKGRTEDRFYFAAQRVLEDVQVGDSIAVNGCCLTVVEFDSGTWTADVTSETRKRTTLDRLQPGNAINFERPVRLQDRLGGHLVQGHVDGIGEVMCPGPHLQIRLPPGLNRYAAEKGSIAIDGVSLTVVDITDDCVTIALIPHTMAMTTLGRVVAGDYVNLEMDVMAKYAERLLAFTHPENEIRLLRAQGDMPPEGGERAEGQAGLMPE